MFQISSRNLVRSFRVSRLVSLPVQGLLRKTNPFSLARHFVSTPKAVDFSDSESSINTNHSSLPLPQFYKLCDQALDTIQNRLEQSDLEVPGFESELTSGALSIKVEKVGTWVLNRQTPNRQIWLASPISGPKRFDFNEEDRRWIYHRDQSALKDLLERELSKSLCMSIQFDEEF